MNKYILKIIKWLKQSNPKKCTRCSKPATVEVGMENVSTILYYCGNCIQNNGN